jgi:peptidyl-prolyl cis-trans isomerase SurA
MDDGQATNSPRIAVTFSRVLATAALALAVGTTDATAQTTVINGIVASVDGSPLTLRDLQEYDRTRSPFLPPEARGDYEVLLNALVETRLLAFEFEEAGIDASDTDVELYIEGLLRENGQTRENVQQALDEVGLQWSDYFERMRQEVQRLALINAVIRSRVSVSHEDAERAWKTDPRFVEPTKVEIAHIYLPFAGAITEAERDAVRASAAEIRAGIRSARSFAAAAKEYSKGPTADEGGSLGAFRRGAMAAHFEEAVEGLDDGGISAPIETPDGIHIVRLERTLAPRRRPLEEVEESLRAELYEQRLNERFERWASKDLREKHFIELKLDELALIVAS